MHISRVQREKPVITKYKVKNNDLKKFKGFLELKSLLNYLEKDYSQMAIYESPLYSDYLSYAKKFPKRFSWARKNLSNNGFIIENPEEKKELDVYVIESGKILKKYNKTFVSSLKSEFYKHRDILKVKKQTKGLLAYYWDKYEKTRYDEFDKYKSTAFAFDSMVKKISERFQKFLKNYNIKEFKFDNNMYNNMHKTFFKK